MKGREEMSVRGKKKEKQMWVLRSWDTPYHSHGRELLENEKQIRV